MCALMTHGQSQASTCILPTPRPHTVDNSTPMYHPAMCKGRRWHPDTGTAVERLVLYGMLGKDHRRSGASAKLPQLAFEPCTSRPDAKATLKAKWLNLKPTW